MFLSLFSWRQKYPLVIYIHFKTLVFINDVSLISSVQSLSRIPLSATPWTAAHQASLSITDSRSLLKLMSIAVGYITSNHLIVCHPLLLLPSIFPSIRVFSNESYDGGGGGLVAKSYPTL